MKFPLVVVVGAQWGDEGKGKLIDMLAAKFDVVGRFNGGNNAGHTIIYKGEPVRLHVTPSGVFEKKKLVIAQGAVFDPEVLLDELKLFSKLKISPNLLIDYRVNLVMPYHKLMDGASEAWKGKKATGSVKVGIGYCYEDRNNRSGIRCEDLLYPKILREKIFTIFPIKKAILEKAYGVRVTISAEKIYRRMLFFAKILKPYIGGVSDFIQKNSRKKRILFEGAMGIMLDGQFGTYPFTVANNTVSTSLFSSVGIRPAPLEVGGVVKVYTTRVGGGPFPTEQKNKIGKSLQTVGREIAATSGRIRRCGWLDLPVVRYSHRLNGFSWLALTKLDVLSTFDKIPVCVAYQLGKKKIYEYPMITHEFYHCKPIYQIFKGWKKDISMIRKFKDLPPEAKKYVTFIGRSLKVPIRYIFVGPERNQTIRL